MTIALLATGDEIIHGDTLNTNSYNIAQILSSEGLSLGLHLVCSDKESELYESIRFLAINHDLLIITGGLGPTSDDRTRFALARYLQVELIEFPEAREHLIKFLQINKNQLDKGNQQQTLFPTGAITLPNPKGTAMGCYFKKGVKQFVLLPGPPRECLPMFNQFVLPLLHQINHSEKKLLKWRVFGVAESKIAQLIDKALTNIDCKIGYRLDTPYVECKVSCKRPLEKKIKGIIDPLVLPYLIASPEQKASERLHETLVEKQILISIIDEATGGLLQTLIQHPDSYSWVKFHHDPTARFNFHLSGLLEFWSGEGKTGKTKLYIDCKKINTNSMNIQETHEINYLSPLVLYSAAELLSFRLVHLINQLHQ